MVGCGVSAETGMMFREASCSDRVIFLDQADALVMGLIRGDAAEDSDSMGREGNASMPRLTRCFDFFEVVLLSLLVLTLCACWSISLALR